jgi:hypothetical protein
MKPGIPQGAMMDAAGAKPGDLARAQRHFLAALAPQDETPRHAPISLAPLVRAAAQGSGAAAAVARQASLALHATAALPSLVADPEAWTEACSLASAIAQQWQGLQAQWIQGWTELAKDASEWRQPNTLTKLMCQESDLMGRGVALLAAQVTSTVSAQEDMLVGISWWMSHRGGTA